MEISSEIVEKVPNIPISSHPSAPPPRSASNREDPHARMFLVRMGYNIFYLVLFRWRILLLGVIFVPISKKMTDSQPTNVKQSI